MIEDDFNTLLTAVAEVFDVPKFEICKGKSSGTAKARQFMCHAIYHGHVHLMEKCKEKLNIPHVVFYKSADLADKNIHDHTEDLVLMNEIRERVGLPKLKRAVKHKDNVSNTKTLFGFDYTELDALRLLNACRGAREYMQKLCSIGRQPIPDGMVYSPLRPKRTYDSWYQD